MNANFGGYNPAQYINRDNSISSIGNRFANVVSNLPQTIRAGEQWRDESDARDANENLKARTYEEMRKFAETIGESEDYFPPPEKGERIESYVERVGAKLQALATDERGELDPAKMNALQAKATAFRQNSQQFLNDITDSRARHALSLPGQPNRTAPPDTTPTEAVAPTAGTPLSAGGAAGGAAQTDTPLPGQNAPISPTTQTPQTTVGVGGNQSESAHSTTPLAPLSPPSLYQQLISDDLKEIEAARRDFQNRTISKSRMDERIAAANTRIRAAQEKEHAEAEKQRTNAENARKARADGILSDWGKFKIYRDGQLVERLNESDLIQNIDLYERGEPIPQARTGRGSGRSSGLGESNQAAQDFVVAMRTYNAANDNYQQQATSVASLTRQIGDITNKINAKGLTSRDKRELENERLNLERQRNTAKSEAERYRAEMLNALSFINEVPESNRRTAFLNANASSIITTYSRPIIDSIGERRKRENVSEMQDLTDAEIRHIDSLMARYGIPNDLRDTVFENVKNAVSPWMGTSNRRSSAGGNSAPVRGASSSGGGGTPSSGTFGF